MNYEDFRKQEEMKQAEDDFVQAMKALEKAERDLYLSVFWLDYIKEHKN